MAEQTGKHPGGAPTKYKEDYCKQIIEYFKREPYRTEYKREYNKDGSIKSEYPILFANDLPTYQEFADQIGVHVDTLNEWCKVHKEFSEAYARAKQKQEQIWLVNGLNGQYNSQFAQFFGKNCLGYRDKVEVDMNSNVTIIDDYGADSDA